MKKLLSLAVLVGAICVAAGCDDKKTTQTKPTPATSPSPAGKTTT